MPIDLEPYRKKYVDLRTNNLKDALFCVGANHEFEQISQMAFMMYVGLKPDHKFLDLACGCLRGTGLLVDYVKQGNFHGADVSFDLLGKVQERLLSLGVNKQPTLHHLTDYDFKKTIKETFDFILSVSLFTHLLPNDVFPLFSGVRDILSQNGIYYFTLYPCENNYEGDVNVMRFNKQWIIGKGLEAGLVVEDIPGDYINPSPVTNYIKRVNVPIMAQWVMRARKA